MTVVDSKTFWTGAFDADEADGLTVRVGPFRCAPVGEWCVEHGKWAVMLDGAEYPNRHTWDTRQEAIDFMVEDFFAGGALTSAMAKPQA